MAGQNVRLKENARCPEYLSLYMVLCIPAVSASGAEVKNMEKRIKVAGGGQKKAMNIPAWGQRVCDLGGNRKVRSREGRYGCRIFERGMVAGEERQNRKCLGK